jgi:hypothetical protein
MVVEIGGSYFIYCDARGCGRGDNPNADGDGARGARRNARKLGWARRRRNCGLTAHYVDLCPECARANNGKPDAERGE